MIWLCAAQGEGAPHSCGCLNISIFYLFSFHQGSLANLNLLFLVVHVALGGWPAFTSDMRNHTNENKHSLSVSEAHREMTTVATRRSSTELNPTTFDIIFPTIWQVIKSPTERHQSTTNRLLSTGIIASLQIVIWKQKHFIHHFINQSWKCYFQETKVTFSYVGNQPFKTFILQNLSPHKVLN